MRRDKGCRRGMRRMLLLTLADARPIVSAMPVPSVEPGDPIRIGNVPAIVADVHAEGDVEAVYLDHRGLALAEDAIWREAENGWAFKTPGGAAARFVDRKPRMAPYVQVLRGRHKPSVLTFPGKVKRKE